MSPLLYCLTFQLTLSFWTLISSVKSGKTSLINRLVNDVFDYRYKPTIEDHFNFVVQEPGGSCTVVDAFDTSGSNEFPAMRELRIQQSQVFVVVYSVTCRATFDYAIWMCENIRRIKAKDNVPIVLVGNKIDLSTERAVTYSEGYQIMQDNLTCYFVETSARHRDNVIKIMDIVMLQKDSQRDHEDLKQRLSQAGSGNLVFDQSVRSSSLDTNASDLWQTPKVKRKSKKRCSIM